MALKTLRRWVKIRRARRAIAKLLSERVSGIRVFSTPGAALLDLRRVEFVIATTTEAEAESLRQDYSNLYSQLCSVMKQVGYSPDAILLLRFPVESQEFVNREHGGNWHALWGRH